MHFAILDVEEKEDDHGSFVVSNYMTYASKCDMNYCKISLFHHDDLVYKLKYAISGLVVHSLFILMWL